MSIDEDRSYTKVQSVIEQIRYEFTNQDTIMLKKSGAYHKAVGNSAVMLKILGAKTKIRSKYNAFYAQEVLEMSLHSSKYDEIKKYLQTISSKTLRDDENFYIVRLKTPISAKRIRNARTSKELKTEVTLDILLKKRYNTPLAKEVRHIFQEVGVLVRTMKVSDGEVLGKLLLTEVLELQSEVRALTRSKHPTLEQLQSIDDKADDVSGFLLLTPNFEQHAVRLSNIGRSINIVRTSMMKAINDDATR